MVRIENHKVIIEIHVLEHPMLDRKNSVLGLVVSLKAEGFNHVYALIDMDKIIRLHNLY
jgi:hypothetical protein